MVNDEPVALVTEPAAPVVDQKRQRPAGPVGCRQCDAVRHLETSIPLADFAAVLWISQREMPGRNPQPNRRPTRLATMNVAANKVSGSPPPPQAPSSMHPGAVRFRRRCFANRRRAFAMHRPACRLSSTGERAIGPARGDRLLPFFGRSKERRHPTGKQQFSPRGSQMNTQRRPRPRCDRQPIDLQQVHRRSADYRPARRWPT